MKYNFIQYTFIIILICFATGFSQTDSTYQNTENTLDDILDNPNGEADNSDLFDIIEQLQENPVNLNTASISDLEQIPAIDLATAKLIILHRKKYGKYFSKNELNTVEGLTSVQLKKILPFVTVIKKVKSENSVSSNSSLFGSFYRNANVKLRSRVINNLQQKAGFTDHKFLGTPFNSYNRLLFGYSNHYQIGLLTQKDPGEKSLDEFKSFHLTVRNYSFLKTLVLGDYLVQFGQGLALWSPYGFSKGVDAIYPVKKKSRDIIPYTSSDENRFFRGAAAEFNYKRFSFSLFYSRNYFDANIDSTSGLILSTPLSGYHRTESEIMKKHTAYETFYGSSIKYSKPDFFTFGFLYYRSAFNHSFFPSSRFSIEGKLFNYLSVSYNIYYKNLNLFGETTYDGKSVASFGNLQFQITDQLAYLISIRSYPRNFINLHGFGFGEKSGTTQNEFGIYNGFKWKTFLGIVNFYYDQFRFPFASYSIPLPSEGNEMLVFLDSKPVKHLETRIKLKYENKDVSFNTDLLKQTIKRIRKSIRLELIYDISKTLQLKGRFEYNNYDLLSENRREEGYLYFQGVKIKIEKLFDIYGGMTFFNTDSFNSAVYEYENDLTGVFANHAMFGSGVRWYLLLHYMPISFVKLSCKYAETVKPGHMHLSSGYNQINGDMDNWFSFQLDVKF